MTSSKSAEVMLDQLCRQARRALDPDVDASAIEAAVFLRVARSNADSLVVPRRTSRRFLIPAGALALAATVVLVATHELLQHRSSVGVMARGQLAEEPGMDGSLLLFGQVIEARDSDLTVKHRDIGSWRLRAPGRIRVIETGQRITLALERGRVDADVIPQHQPEVLAVEVEQLRVAVHGTVFSVERRGDIAEVVVREGTVSVGSSVQGEVTRGQLIAAPSHVSFDVRPEQPEVSPNTDDVKLPHRAPHLTSTASTQPPVEQVMPPPTMLSERPSVVEVERLWEAAAREIADCFVGQPGGDPNVRVSFTTQIQLRVAPKGNVSVVGFNPPVPEYVHSCAEQRVSLLHTAPSELGTLVSRPKVLTR